MTTIRVFRFLVGFSPIDRRSSPFAGLTLKWAGRQRLLISLYFVSLMTALAQPTAPLAHRWGLETSPVYPIFAQNYLLQATRTLWHAGSLQGDVVVGIEVLNHTKADAVMLSQKAWYGLVGYRQYLWRGLHLQVVDLFTPRLRVQSAVDGQTYAGSANVLEGFIGYRWLIPVGQTSLYILSQVGLGKSLSTQQPWPSQSTTTEFIPNLLIGIRF